MPRGQGGTLSGFTPLSTPNAPTIDSVSAGIGSASVSFTAPSDTGDAAVTSYIVTAVNESTGASSGVTGTSSPISISPGGGTFKIRMQAVNGFGPGRLTEFDTGNVIYSGAELYSWGSNSWGQLGDNSTYSASSPVQVGSLTTWRVLGAGYSQSFAIKSDGTLWSWGNNAFGELGQNNVTDLSSPTQVGALTNWRVVSGGRLSAFAIKTDNTLWGWGYGRRIGDNSSVDKSSPVQIGSLSDWSTVSAQGNVALAIKTDGTLWSWGVNSSGALGDGTVINRSSPVQVGSLTNWAAVFAGKTQFPAVYSTVSAIKQDGTLWSWGANDFGQIGDNTTINRSSPVQVGALTNWSAVSRGTAFALAVKENNSLWSWGRNNIGQLGHNDVTNRSSPVQIGALTDWSTVISAGNIFSAAVKQDGSLWNWGLAEVLGTGDGVSRSSPVQVGSLTNWINVSAGNSHTLALVGV